MGHFFNSMKNKQFMKDPVEVVKELMFTLL